MKKINETINSRLDSESFAKSCNKPHIAGWIKRNHELGHWSKNDFSKIIKWVDEKNPNLENYDFKSALHLADTYLNSIKKTNFDRNAEINFKSPIIHFENGKEWHKINKEDCNGVIHKILYDCSDDLREVHSGTQEGWILIDDQESILCIAINDNNNLKIIGRLGKDPTDCYNEINTLCVRKGLPLSPHAFSYEELIDAIKSKIIDINSINNVSEFIKKLKPQDIIYCNLTKYCHYCNYSDMLYIYLKTKQECILKYILAGLIVHGLTKGSLYETVKNLVNKNPNTAKEFMIKDAVDSRPFIDLMDKCQKEIIKL